MRKRLFPLVLALFVLFTASLACAAPEEPASGPVSASLGQYAQDHPSSDTALSVSGEGSPKTMTRLELVQAIWTAAGRPEPGHDVSFADVPPEAADAASGAADEKIVPPSAPGFAATAVRQDLAVMLWRASGRPAPGEFTRYTDLPSISLSCILGTLWVQSEGLMVARNGAFRPNLAISKEETARVLQAWKDKMTPSLPYDGIYPEHEPYGTGTGLMPGRVVWTYEPESVHWDGNGYWWEPEHFDEETVLSMVRSSLCALADEDSAQSAWDALFMWKNSTPGRPGAYTPGQKIAIKANINGSAVMNDDTSGRTQMSYTNPVLLRALLLSLTRDAGVPAGDITVYDVSRLFPDYMTEMCTRGELAGVQFVGRNNGQADESAPIQWSHAFSGAVNYLPTCVTEADYMINLANLKGHSYGITLCGKNHFGSFINGNMMRPPEGANLHQWLTKNETGIYSPLTDLMANADLGGKTVLYMLDALICAPSEGAQITGDNARWQQSPFDGGYTASVLVSQDPVAIDSVGADFLSNEPAVTGRNPAVLKLSSENCLHEAALADGTPSGTSYTDSQGHTVQSLGVHEHWDNSTSKKYSRNRGADEGIELVSLLPGRGAVAAEDG